MRFNTSSPTSSILVRRSSRIINAFDLESSFPFLRIPDDNLINHDFNSTMEKNASDLSHDEVEDLRVPPKQFQNLSTKLDKECNWIMQENHNQDSLQAIESLKKVLHDND